jgi:hypothetical protein
VYQLSWGITKARVLPQLYLSSQPYQWANIVRYADEQDQYMVIDGVVTSYQVVGEQRCPFHNPIPWHAMPADALIPKNFLSPLQAWTAIHDLMSEQRVPYVIDFVNAPY